MRRFAILVVLLGLSACKAPPAVPTAEGPADPIVMQVDIATLEASDPTLSDPGVRTVALNWSVTNNSPEVIPAAKVPAPQLVDRLGRAWDEDVRLYGRPGADLENTSATDIAPGKALAGSVIYTVPADVWDGACWTARWGAVSPPAAQTAACA